MCVGFQETGVSFLVLSAAFSVENYDFTVSTQICSLSSAVSGTQGGGLLVDRGSNLLNTVSSWLKVRTIRSRIQV